MLNFLTLPLLIIVAMLALLIIYYYYIKSSIKDKVRIAIQTPNKKIAYYNVFVVAGKFKVEGHSYVWDDAVNTGEVVFQILPGLSEFMRYGQYLLGQPTPIKFADGKVENAISGELLTEIVENQAIQNFLAGFKGIDNELLLKLIIGAAIVNSLIIASATNYIHPFI